MQHYREYILKISNNQSYTFFGENMSYDLNY